MVTTPAEREDNEGKKFGDVGGEIVVKTKIHGQSTTADLSSESGSYTQRLAYNAQGMVEYIGVAQPGTVTSAASWKIRKMIYTGFNITEILWCDGDLLFDNVWDNYASLSYS